MVHAAATEQLVKDVGAKVVVDVVRVAEECADADCKVLVVVCLLDAGQVRLITVNQTIFTSNSPGDGQPA